MSHCCDTVPVPLACSLYLHIPFCIKKCSYCDFLSGPQDEETIEAYVRALIREMEFWSEKLSGRPVDTVFLGGGTPSVLSAGQAGRIMQTLYDRFSVLEDAEISMEMNPGTADAGKLEALRASGINRLSIGVQSLHDEELRLLGRIHTARQAREAYRLARRAGFDNINLDLMSALPGQTVASWRETLEEAVSWEPEHISAYSLIIEPGTPFASLLEAGRLPALPDEEVDREMYQYTGDFLGQHGYGRYEISNYARPGRECRHNLGYWTGHPYLGMGIGAASYMDHARFCNCRDLDTYIKVFGDKEHPEKDPAALVRLDFRHLSRQDEMEEFMFLGLRRTAGISAEDFQIRFGKKIEDVYGQVLDKHVSSEVLEKTEEGYRLTPRGVDVSNYVLADYLM